MRRLVFTTPALAVLLLAGCGGSPPPVTPVEGVVSFSVKQPANNLLVQFHPLTEGGGKPLSGSGVTDAAGKFRITCDDGRDGLPAGKYVVTVTDNNLSVEGDDNPTAAPKVVNRVPVRYATTGNKNTLQLTVEAGKTSGYDLKLELQ